MSVIRSGRVDLGPMVTHRFRLDNIEKAYELFGHQRDGVLKVAIEDGFSRTLLVGQLKKL